MKTKKYINAYSKLFLAIGFLFIANDFAYAQFGSTPSSGGGTGIVYIDNDRLVAVINLILSYLEGSFGALVMVIGGILAIISAAFGQYKAAMGLLIVAIGCFILRSIVNTFFGGILNSTTGV